MQDHWVGVEQEFELFDSTGNKLDFRKLFAEVAADTPPVLFRNISNARLTASGYVLSSDAEEAEYAIAPLQARGDQLDAVAPEALRAREDLLARLEKAGVTTVKGYSTHISISCPNDSAWPLADELIATIVPALMLLLECRDSQGILVRPRYQRIELCGEYLDHPDDLLAATLFCYGAVALLGGAHAIGAWPRFKPRDIEPSNHRQGYRVKPDVYGEDIAALGRKAVLQLSNGGAMAAGAALAQWVELMSPLLEGTASEQAIRQLRQRAAGLAPTPIERGGDEAAAVRRYPIRHYASAYAHRIAAIATQLPQAGYDIAFFDWTGIALREPEQGNLVAVPLAMASEVIDAVTQGRFNGWMETLPHRDEALVRVEQLQTPGIYRAMNIARLGRSADGGKKKKGDGPPVFIGPPVIAIAKWPCKVKVILAEKKLCPNEVGSAKAITDPAKPDKITWVLPAGLRLLTGQGTHNITYKAVRGGLHKVKCIIQNRDRQCQDDDKLVVPETGLITGDNQPVFCVGIAGHAPGIRLTEPAASGSSLVAAPAPRQGGSTMLNVRSQFRVSGNLVDPLGYKGASLTVQPSPGVSVTTTSVAVDETTGAFQFTATATGLGLKRLVLRARGITGAEGIAVVSGMLAPSFNFHRSLSAIRNRVGAALTQDKGRGDKLLFGDGNQAPDTLPPLTQATLDTTSRPLHQELDQIDNDYEDHLAAMLDHLEFRWSVGETAMSDALSQKSRYRLLVNDALAPVSPTADLLDRTFALDLYVTTLLSADPEAFVPVPGGHDDEPVPRTVNDVMQDITQARENDWVIMNYRDCNSIVGAPYRVTVEGQPFALINLPNVSRFQPPTPAPTSGGASGGPVTGGTGVMVVVGGGPRYETRVRKKPARLEAALHGKCDTLTRFEWRVVYGPDLSKAEVETEGAKQEIGKFSAEVPGLYLVEARAVTDHDNPLAGSVFEVEVLDVELAFDCPKARVLEDEHGRQALVSADHGPHVEVTASLQLSGDSGNAPLNVARFRHTLRWAGTEEGGAVTDSNDRLKRAYRIGTRAGEFIAVNGYLTELVVTDRQGQNHRYDLAGVSFDDDYGTIIVVPGKVSRTTLKILSPGVALRDATTHTLTPFEAYDEFQYENIDDIRESALSLQEFRIGEHEHMRLVVQARDQHNNPLPPETEVEFQSYCSGEILTQGGSDATDHLFTLNGEGRVTAGYRVPEDSLDKSLIKLTVQDQTYYIGNAMSALTFRALSPAANITTDVNGTTIAVHELSGGAYVDIEVLGPGGHATNARFKIDAQAGGGSIKSREADNWVPNLVDLTDSDGILRLYLNPEPHTPDGDVPIGARKVWGDTNLIVAIGHVKQVFTLRYDSIASVQRVPHLELPALPLVQQNNLQWVPRPADANPGGGASVTPGTIRGQQGREIIVEIKENVEFTPYAHFAFNTPATGLWNPPLANGAPPDPNYTPPIAIELKGRDHSGVGAALAGHAVIEAHPQTPSPAGGNALKLAYSIPAALADLDYSASVPGSAGFRLKFYVRCSADQEQWDVLRVIGASPSYQPLSDRGELRISFSSLHIPPSLIVEYNARGCPSRPQTRMIPIPVQVPLERWIHVDISVMPDFARDRVDVDATFNDGAGLNRTISRQGENFNFLTGKMYFLKLGMPDDGEAWLDNLEYLIPQNTALHMRSAEGLSSLWHMEVLANDEVPAPVENRERDGVPRPQFQQSLEPLADVTVAYCDATEFERVRIGAADRQLAQAGAYTSDVILSFLIGDSQTVPGMASDFAAGMVGWGDLRDVVKNLAYAWPGGRDPDWAEFGLALSGLAMDVAQVFTAGSAAAPNALIGVIKVMLKRIRPYVDQFPQAARIASDLTRMLRKVLVEMRGVRIAQGATAVLTLDQLRQIIPSGFIDFIFQGLTEDHLKTFVEFAKSLSPPFNPLMTVLSPTSISDAIDFATGLQENVGRVEEMRKVIELLMARIDLIAFFFNPTLVAIRSFDNLGAIYFRMTDDFIRLFPNMTLEATVRMRQLLDGQLSWNFSSKFAGITSAGVDVMAARRITERGLEVLGRYMNTNARLFEDPRVLRGFYAFCTISGPHKAARYIRNFRGRPEVLQRTLRLCDFAVEIVEGAATLTGATARQQREALHQVWHGLSVRAGLGGSLTGSVPDARLLGSRQVRNAMEGAETELLSIAAFARGRQQAASGLSRLTRFNPYEDGEQIMDFIGLHIRGGFTALEAKSSRVPIDDFAGTLSGIINQYRRWVVDGVASRQGIERLNYAVNFHNRDSLQKLEAMTTALQVEQMRLLARHVSEGTDLPPMPVIFLLDTIDLPAGL